MASGRFLLAAALSISATTVALPSFLQAEDTLQPENAPRHTFIGRVNANAVFVRSRASEDAYPTMKLNRDSQVTVVDVKGNWLKILPPEGSFAYVPKSFVTARGDGTVGRASREIIVRAGSTLNDMAANPLVTVPEGTDVKIVGTHNEYFKVTPPEGSFVWVNKQFVDPVRVVLAKQDAAAPGPDKGPLTTTDPLPPQPGGNTPLAGNDSPTTHPAGQLAEGSETSAPPTTQPSSGTAIADYEKLEAQFTEANTKPIGEQPLPELLTGYQKVVESEDLPSSMRSIAEVRIASLKARNEAREKFLAVKDDQKKMAERQQALVAEKTEIEERIKQSDIQTFAAVGTLRTSSLQIGQTGVLYRLTDPATGRTVAYVRTTDAKYAGFIGQFIGVKGAITNDPQLKSVVENPLDAVVVDPTKLNSSIAAQIVPPSLLPKGPQAATAGARATAGE